MDFMDLKAQYRALKPKIDARIQAVLDHGHYIMGPEVAELEAQLSRFAGTRHCVTVASGTEALLISLMAVGVGPGDEVITSPFTFVATAETIALLGAIPVLVDIEADTFNLDPARLEEAFTLRTKAVIPVSLYGQPAGFDDINAIAAKHGVPVIEDAAQSFGATYRARRSCGLSSIGCTSFFPSKPLGCYGDGGAIFTDDDGLAQAMREIRVHGQQRRYFHTRIGVGGRMDTLQCAIVLAKLERFPWEIEQRQRLAGRYGALLAEVPGVTLPIVRDDRTSVFAQYTVRVRERNEIARLMSEAGVPTAVHYPVPLNHQPAYAGRCQATDLPLADAAAAEVLSLPMYPDMPNDIQDRVAQTLRAAAAGVSPVTIGG